MHKRCGRLLMGLLLAAGLLASSSAWASSVSGYACMVEYQPPFNTTMGSYGNVSVTVYSGTSCTGSYLGEFWFCTTNATDYNYCAIPANCGGTTSYLYSEAAINTLFGNLRGAVNANQRLNVNYCGGNGGEFMTYFAD
jgi:hypothetical protein